MRAASLILGVLIGSTLGCEAPSSPDMPPEAPPADGPEAESFGWLQPAAPIAERASLTPVPIRGGGLVIDETGRYFVVADPDRHRVLVADMTDTTIGRDRAVNLGAEPVRVAIAGERALVTLREDFVVLVDLAEHREIGRVAVCAAPRGVAWDGEHAHVACAGGDLVALDADGIEVSRVFLDKDLRDVVIEGDRRYVSRFRTAEVLIVEDGALVDRWRPYAPDELRAPVVAWQMRAMPAGGVAISHQNAQTSELVFRPAAAGYYGTVTVARCPSGAVTTSVTVFGADGEVQVSSAVPRIVLGVDFVPLPDGQFVIADAGRLLQGMRARLYPSDCADVVRLFAPNTGEQTPEELVAVAHGPDGVLYGLGRSPLSIHRLDDNTWRTVLWLDDGLVDAGHRLFHRDVGPAVACASCHPEGSQDGHTWHMAEVGQRRTQDLRGGLRGTEPFHWDEDQRDIASLMAEVLVRRMGGFPVDADVAEDLLDWLDALPVDTLGVQDKDAVARGKAVFERADVGCADCHYGPRLSDDRFVDVGTGGRFAVPSLRGLALRAPYMHDGCAPTLADRFDADCGGDAHGEIEHLHAAERADLITYLESL